MKYILLERNRNITMYELDKCSYIKAGWRKPSVLFQVGDWQMKHPIKSPARYYKPMISVPGLNTWANNARLVSDELANKIDEIDLQIKQLRIKRQQLIEDEFRTLPLIKKNQLTASYENKDRYSTKSEAIKAKQLGKEE